ncbi:MAG: acyltransferase domain-containing protein [Desulfobacterales bacterium]|nr:acyltransferase domain-containing protein [Desulfobacterales bacterium]
MKKTVFIYSGEGTHGPETTSDLFKTSEKWHEAKAILRDTFNLNLEPLWNENLGKHTCPFSPLRTLVSQICLADIWSNWGHTPDIMVGHSTGELAAAFEAGFYALEQVLALAHDIGRAAANLEGRMAHGWMSDTDKSDIHISSINFRHRRRGIHVTLSDVPDRIDAFLKEKADFTPMPLPHPWHHPAYAPYTDHLKVQPSATIDPGHFISGLTGQWETCLPDTHWQDWMIRPIDFIAAMDSLKDGHPDTHLTVIEIGAHPVLAPACRGLGDYIHVPSLCRGEPDEAFILAQRRKLEA